PSPPSHTRSLHDALPIYLRGFRLQADRSRYETSRIWSMRGGNFAVPLSNLKLVAAVVAKGVEEPGDLRSFFMGSSLLFGESLTGDRKSTRLNSSHVKISY